MLQKKHKRKILRKIPFVFAGLLLVTIFLILVSALSYIASSKIKLISPLAQNPQEGNRKKSLEYELYKDNIQFSKTEVASDSSLLVFLKDDGVVQISEKKDLASQITSLQLILGRLTIEGRKFKKLDLRFNQPIIVF